AKQSDKKTAPAKKKVLTERLSPESQSEIIERFIDKEPRISAKTIKATEADQTDLSEKSTVYSEDLISENLAQILLAQGKKDKAIDIYKKLIWKFPQKKSYFAAQIEEIQR
ncbi:MAG: tetratricopeptide repeat protein, partial [Bacteroidota bacterium]